jgi:enoyl-CoA hydratase
MAAVSAPTVETEVREQVLVVTLSRPSKRNAVNAQMTEELRVALDLLEEDHAIRVGILTGAGGSFCSGADLRAGPAGEHLHDHHGFASITRRRRSKPLIAAVEGAAHAGGFEIVLSCDIVVAAEDATFALPEPKRGVMAGTGLVRLPRNIGFSVAAEIGLTGAPFTAPRAYQVGLISRVSPPGVAPAGRNRRAEDELDAGSANLLRHAEQVALGAPRCAPRRSGLLRRKAGPQSYWRSGGSFSARARARMSSARPARMTPAPASAAAPSTSHPRV